MSSPWASSLLQTTMWHKSWKPISSICLYWGQAGTAQSESQCPHAMHTPLSVRAQDFHGTGACVQRGAALEFTGWRHLPSRSSNCSGSTRQPRHCCQKGNTVPSTLNPVATSVQSRLDPGWCASEASGWAGQGSGGPGHRAKASAKTSQEREWAVHGAQNKICSIPSVSTLFQKMTYWTFPGIAVPRLSTVSWKYTQEKWLPSSRDPQKAWTGSRLQSVAEVVMLLHQLVQEQRMQGAWRKGCLFSPFSSCFCIKW